MATAKSKVNSVAELKKELGKIKTQLASAKKKAVSEYQKDVKQLKKQIEKQLSTARTGFSKIKSVTEKAARTDADLAAKLAHEGVEAMKSVLDTAHNAMTEAKKELAKSYAIAKSEAKTLSAIAQQGKKGAPKKKAVKKSAAKKPAAKKPAAKKPAAKKTAAKKPAAKKASAKKAAAKK